MRDEIVKKELEKGNYRCLPYIVKNKEEAVDNIDEVLKHVISIYQTAYIEAGKRVNPRDLLENIFNEFNFDKITRALLLQHFENEVLDNRTFYCSKIRSLFGVPETVCQTCKVYNSFSLVEPSSIIQKLISSIKEVTSDGEVVTVYVASERLGGASIPYRIKYNELIRLLFASTPSTENKQWDKVGKPVLVALTLASLSLGLLPSAEMRNVDTLPLWEDILKRVKFEVEDPSEIVRIIKEVVEESIPDDLNNLDPNNHALTPSLVNYFAKTGELLSPKVVIKEKSGVFKAWVHGKFLQSHLSLVLGRELNIKQLKNIIVDLGGSTSAKLATNEFKNLRGFEIPVAVLGKDLLQRAKEFYGRAEDLGKTKLKFLGQQEGDN